MRESNYTFPPSNRAVISINQMLYDRRALDTNATLALLNNLCQLTYLTSTSPRIREVLTMDGGLERMLDILRDSCLPREPTMPDLWGLNGPSTARIINVDRAISLRHSLAFQCVVNIGVRGNETIRTRVVQAGALDIVAQILESWLKKNGIAIFSSSLGSQAAVDALATGAPLPGVDPRRRRQPGSRHPNSSSSSGTTRNAGAGAAAGGQSQSQATGQTPSQPALQSPLSVTQAQAIAQSQLTATRPTNGPTAAAPNTAADATSPPHARGLGQLVHVASLITTRLQSRAPNITWNGGAGTRAAGIPQLPVQLPTTTMDTDVDMADGETDAGETDAADTDTGADASMDVEFTETTETVEAGPSQATTTPRAHMPVLPLQIPRRSPEPSAVSQSNATSLSGDEPPAIPRARSDNSLAITNAVAAAESGRPASGLAARIPQLATDSISTQSSPLGVSAHASELVEGMHIQRGRRGTIVGRPLLVPPREPRGQDESEASDGAPETDMQQATIDAGLAAAAANAAMEAATAVPNQPENAPQPAIVDGLGGITGMVPEDPDPEALAAEQARFDMEAGAPPGQPGATPRVATVDVQLPTANAVDLATQVATAPPAQIIIANGAPRGFQDLASYVGVSMLLNPEGSNYSDDNILLALQLLAYLSKYPHVRATFHHPRRPMHRYFDLGGDDSEVQLPQRPAYSETPNIFSLVERFTFRPSPSDPNMSPIPSEIQYWAGVIMRNACRKDDAQGGIRQCAYMSCGRWEVYPREFAKCRRCRKAKYCSKECQSKAWSEGHRFWCSVRAEPEPSADAGGNAPTGGTGGGGSGRRDPPPRRDDDEDVDMSGDGGGRGGGAIQATPRAAPTARQHTAVVPIGGDAGDRGMQAAPRPPNTFRPVGAMTLPRHTQALQDLILPDLPMAVPSPFSAPAATQTQSLSQPPASAREATPSPSPAAMWTDRQASSSSAAGATNGPRNSLPAFLKLGRPGGPSSTADMTNAMHAYRRSDTPPQH
ncbi:hypothetical protein Q8F55_001104 [Vanrija albida]|uniref:MYND-type domain-containing protein n=1 Tax=Vanrija albida TaxID=181172 RepID=A0ABR3QFB9_9TREE